MESCLKLSGIILSLGLVAESLCLLWSRPLAFIFLITFGGLFIFLGVAVYLLAIASLAPTSPAIPVSPPNISSLAKNTDSDNAAAWSFQLVPRRFHQHV
jgi:ABC-type xylose transport system permease subunit